jgi:hypothetical protein
MTDAERIAQLERELAEAKGESKQFYIKMGNKQNVVFGGKGLGQRFPVTLYAPSWMFLLDHAEEIREFIEENRDSLSWDRQQ